MVIDSAEYGGAERYGVRLAIALSTRFQVTVALRELARTSVIRRDLAAAAVDSVRVPDARRIRGVIGFARLLSRLHPDVVHVTAPWPDAFPEIRTACALMGVPAVIVNQVVPEPGELTIDHPTFYAWTRRRGQTWVAVSRYGRSLLGETFGMRNVEEIEVIHNGVPMGTDQPRSRGDARNDLGLAEGDYVIVDVARLSSEKGVHTLIDAVGRLMPHHPQIRLLVAGEGPQRAELQAQIERAALQEEVRLLGRRDGVSDLLAAADLFVFPSVREGLPFALLEAVAQGVPVVATSFGGVEEIITPGENGLVVPTKHPEALAAAIETSISSPEAAMARAARGVQTSRGFSAERMVDRTAELLEERAAGK